MALQGTLDTFALPDVLRLLASTGKTGRLRVTGDRGSGAVWFRDGRLGGAALGDAGDTHHPDEVLLQLLRSTEGSFVFDAGVSSDTLDVLDDTVDEVLARVEVLLAEWRDIEAMIPSPESWLSLVDDLAAVDGGVEAVTVDAAAWAVVVAIGSGSSVDRLLDLLPGDELGVLRTLKTLVERGLVAVGEPRAATLEADPVHAGASDPALGRPASSPADAAPLADPVRALEAVFAGRGDDVTTRPSHHELSGLGTVGLSNEGPGADHGPSFGPVPSVSPVGAGRPEHDLDRVGERNGSTALGERTGSTAFGERTGSTAFGERNGSTALGERNGSTAFGEAYHAAPAPPVPQPAPAQSAPAVDAHGADPYGTPVVPGSLSYGSSSHGSSEAFDDHGMPDDPDEAAEIARQLASLSPRAAKAVAAAAKAPTAEEREAALAAIEAEDETVNRGLLLKFLGSVDQ